MYNHVQTQHAINITAKSVISISDNEVGGFPLVACLALCSQRLESHGWNKEARLHPAPDMMFICPSLG